VVEAPRVHGPRGVTIRIKEYDSVGVRPEGDILIEGKLEAFGADMRIDAAGDIRATGGIITNGGAGANAAGQVPTATGGPGARGGNGGGGYGGSGGSGGDGGGSGYPSEMFGSMGTGGTGPGTPSTQVTSTCSSGALFPSGGSAGGSNGTKGAQSQGIDGFFRHIAAEPIGAPVVGMTPPSAGGGSGSGGGCGWWNITNGVKTILSAGGGGGGGGGGAGNVVLRSTGTITIDGSGITANGGNGGNAQPGSGTLARAYDGQSHSYTYGGNGGGGGVGGAGGSVFLQAPTVVLNAAITADGGMGGLGASGGTAATGTFMTNGLAGYDGAGGGGGRIAIVTTNPIAGSAIPSASLGANASGRNAGHPTVYIAMLQLSNTPADYWPVNSLVTPQGNCNSGHVGCTVSHTVTMNPTTGPFPVSGTVQFQLTQVSKLRGDSTNNCSVPDCTDPIDSAEDFYFQDTDQTPGLFQPFDPIGQSMTTKIAVSSATAIVRSRDFGGRARISATVTIGGVGITTSVQATGETFARIPIDVCGALGCSGDTTANGIADSWEQQYGRYFFKEEDVDHNQNDPTAYSGDGYSAHDEYRGFFVYDPYQSTWSHMRTDPLNMKDVFFWDTTGGTFTQPLFNILGRTAVTGQFISYHPILGFTVEYQDPQRQDINAGTNRYNRNTETTSGGFALVYVNAPLCGTEQNPTPRTCAPGTSATLGQAGDPSKGGFNNNGQGPPVKLDDTGIRNCAAALGFPEDVLRAQAVAHETGHKLSRFHYSRGVDYVYTAYNCLSPPDCTGFPAIDPSQFALDAGNASYLYLLRTDYEWPVGTGQFRTEEKLWLVGLLTGNVDSTYYRLGNISGYEKTLVRMQSAVIPAAPFRIATTAQTGWLMDAFPTLSVIDNGAARVKLYSDFQFHPELDLPLLCVKATCP